MDGHVLCNSPEMVYNSRMKKLFASDFDNTLYFHGKQPSIRPGTVEAILKFQDAGNLFGLCTGRPARGLEGYYEGLFTPDFIIGSSGGMILDRNGETLFERTVPNEIIRQLAQMGRNRGFTGAVHAEGRFVLLDAPDHVFPSLPRIKSPEELKGRIVHGISYITDSDAAAERFTRDINSLFPSLVTAFQNRTAVDTTAAGCSKGSALMEAARIFKADRTYGMGDSLNDLPLVTKADVGFTFPAVHEKLQRSADRIVENAAEAILFALNESV